MVEQFDSNDNQAIMRSASSRFRRRLNQDERYYCQVRAFHQAVQKHNPDYQQKFTTSLYRFVVWECAREVERLYGKKNGRKLHQLEDADKLEQPQGDERLEEILEQLELLPEWMSQIVRLHYLEKMTIRQLGQHFGWSRWMTRNRLKRAMTCLRKRCLALEVSHGH